MFKWILAGTGVLLVVFLVVDMLGNRPDPDAKLYGGWTPKDGAKFPLWEFLPKGRAMHTTGSISEALETVTWTDAMWEVKGAEVKIQRMDILVDQWGNEVGHTYGDKKWEAELVKVGEQWELTFKDSGVTFVRTKEYTEPEPRKKKEEGALIGPDGI